MQTAFSKRELAAQEGEEKEEMGCLRTMLHDPLYGLDSPYGVAAVLAAVVVSVLLGFIDFMVAPDSNFDRAMLHVDIFFVALFSLEVVLRVIMLKPWPYLKDWLCLIDVSVTLVDLGVVLLSEIFASLDQASNFITAMRLLSGSSLTNSSPLAG